MKAKKRSLAFGSILALVISGCVSRHAIMVHPETEDQEYCSSSGWGWFGAPHAISIYNRCVAQLERLGYVVPGKQALETDIPDPPEDGEWTVRRAKMEYRSGNVDRIEYERIIQQLKWTYRKDVQEVRQQYRAGLLSKSAYEQKIREAKYRYEG